jgi:hypothetical protein
LIANNQLIGSFNKHLQHEAGQIAIQSKIENKKPTAAFLINYA